MAEIVDLDSYRSPFADLPDYCRNDPEETHNFWFGICHCGARSDQFTDEELGVVVTQPTTEDGGAA